MLETKLNILCRFIDLTFDMFKESDKKSENYIILFENILKQCAGYINVLLI